MAADTSSAPAASRCVVGGAAAAFAGPTADPMFAKSVAAAANISGAANTNDIRYLPSPAKIIAIRALHRGFHASKFEHVNLTRTAVDLDQRSGRQCPGGALDVDHTGETEFA